MRSTQNEQIKYSPDTGPEPVSFHAASGLDSARSNGCSRAGQPAIESACSVKAISIVLHASPPRLKQDDVSPSSPRRRPHDGGSERERTRSHWPLEKPAPPKAFVRALSSRDRKEERPRRICSFGGSQSTTPSSRQSAATSLRSAKCEKTAASAAVSFRHLERDYLNAFGRHFSAKEQVPAHSTLPPASVGVTAHVPVAIFALA